MKLPKNSIKEYTGIDIEKEDILHILAGKIGEVEEVTDWEEMYKGIYVAEIKSKKDHPDADKLGIYTISTGDQEDVQVVAGDKTLEVGDKVAYIQPGNIVPSTYKTSEEFEIKAVKMRGILSNGMLCSEKELNIGPDHTKVLKLESSAPVGELFSKYYDLNDIVFDIENKALTNRGDLFGILGLTREIAGAKSIKFTSPKWYLDNTSGEYTQKDNFGLDIENRMPALCSRYVGVVIDSVTVQESPVWLKSILIKSGIRPINNIVDITNYLSILVGQPLHAFDYNKVIQNDPSTNTKAHIEVRLAKDGERIHTLDNNVVTLTGNNLVIADSTNPIAIAGVIGGLDTEIDSNTKTIILESANFDRFNIRKTSMSLGIFTDAVTRFTKYLDPNQCLPVEKYAISLVLELAGGEVVTPIVDKYDQRYEPSTISLSIEKLNIHLGTNLTKEDIINILTNIEYTILSSDEKYITVKAPSFRTDIVIPEDIHEDIGRIYGYENIKPVLPLRDLKASGKNKIVDFKSRIRKILSYSGANELLTYSFVSAQQILKSNQDPNLAYHIKNSLSPELSLMRTSLITSLLTKAQENIQRNIPTFCIYEFNIAHQKGNMDSFELPKEQWNMSLLFSSRENILDGNPYYQVKRYFEKVYTSLGIEDIEYSLIADTSERDLPTWILNILPTFNPNASAYITYKGNILGILGDLDDMVKKSFKLPVYTAGLEIDLESLLKIDTKVKKYEEGSKFPSITQDITFVVNIEKQYKEIEERILREINTRNRKAKVECLDIYSKDGIKKNLTVRVSIEHMEKTLSDKEMEKIVEKLEKDINE